MGDIMIDTVQVINNLREMYKERGLSIDKAEKIIKEKYGEVAPSRSSIARVFSPTGGYDFNWEHTIRPIADSFLDLEDIKPTDNAEDRIYKSILKLKKDAYEDLEIKVKHQAETIGLLNKQITFKDERIDKLLALNEKLTERLLSCPCGKVGGTNE